MTRAPRQHPSIVHIGPPTPFMSFIADIFEEAAPGENRVLILAASAGQTLHASKSGVRLETLPAGPTRFIKAIQAARQSRLIIAHGMPVVGAAMFLTSRRDTLRMWSGWGAEYYGDETSRFRGLLDPITSDAAQGKAEATGVRALAARVAAISRRHAARRAHLFSAPIPGDFEVFSRRFPAFSGEYAQLNYASQEETFSRGPDTVTGEDILVGNSASYTNNHLDIFASLERSDLMGRKLIVPLSYGESAEYRDVVCRAGRKAFGSDFVPLLEYLDLDTYNQTIAQCGNVVMGHRRQEALGNIGTALSMGARLYLSPSNPILGFLRGLGAVIWTTNDLERQGVSSAPLSDSEAEANRRVLAGFWGHDRVVANAKIVANLALTPSS